MTMYWIYDLPNWLFGILTVLVLIFIALGGLYASRPMVRRLVEGSGRHNDVVSWFFASVSVFFGLAIGLIANGCQWANFIDVDTTVGKEASALAALYRDLDAYPKALQHKFEEESRVTSPDHQRRVARHPSGIDTRKRLGIAGSPRKRHDGLRNPPTSAKKSLMPRRSTRWTTSWKLHSRGFRRSASVFPRRCCRSSSSAQLSTCCYLI